MKTISLTRAMSVSVCVVLAIFIIAVFYAGIRENEQTQEQTKIIDEPEIGSLITLDRNLELKCIAFDLYHGYEGKTLKQKGSCTFLNTTKVIGGDQFLQYYYTIKIDQVIHIYNERYRFNGYKNGKFQFELLKKTEDESSIS